MGEAVPFPYPYDARWMRSLRKARFTQSEYIDYVFSVWCPEEDGAQDHIRGSGPWDLETWGEQMAVALRSLPVERVSF